MKSRYLASLLLALPTTAAADGHKLLVLQSEGRTDAATKQKIDAAIVKLAKTSEAQASGGELNYSDAATAVGCKPDSPTCKDEVMAMLSVDEIVITNVTPKPGGLEVAVSRVSKGGSSRDGKTMIPTGGPADQLDGLAPLFNAPAATPPAITNTNPNTATGLMPPNGEGTPPVAGDPTAPVIPPPTAITAEPLPPPMTNQSPQVDQPSGTRKTLEIAGMAAGGGALIVSFVLWGAASSTQDDIDKAPTKTKQNLIDLKNLEDKADGYATGGNLLFVTGLVLSGVSTYFFIRDRSSSSSSTARLTPTVFDHGAGLALSFGGTP